MANHFIFGSLGWISHVKLYNIDMALEFKRAWFILPVYMNDDPQEVQVPYTSTISSWELG